MERSRARTGGSQPHNPAAIGIHRTGAAEASAARRQGLAPSRLDRRAARNLAYAGAGWFLLLALAYTGYLVVLVHLRADVLDNDLTQAYAAALIGRDHGWSHIYSLAMQRDVFSELRPRLVFDDASWFTPAPPYAWLVLPLTALSPAVAVYTWLGLSVAALVAAWWLAAPGDHAPKALWLVGALAWYPVLYGLSLAQADLLMVLVVAAAWRLARSGRTYLAGAVLALSVLKPQLVLALPLVLLAAGRWRVVLPWAGIGLVVAVMSALSLGAGGLSDYRAILGHESQMVNNRYFTTAYLLGPGPLSYAVPALLMAVAAVGGYLNRRGPIDRLFALGIVASVLAATYWHLQDYTMLVPAAWFFCRSGISAPKGLLLLGVALAGELAWPLTPLPILVGVAVWFAVLVARPSPRPDESPIVPTLEGSA